MKTSCDCIKNHQKEDLFSVKASILLEPSFFPDHGHKTELIRGKESIDPEEIRRSETVEAPRHCACAHSN